MTKLDMDYSGKVVLITGAATGIGKAAARAFAAHGAKIVIGDIDEAASATADELRSDGGDALYVHTNVADSASVQNFIQTSLDTYGRIDAAFNNAGVLPPTADFADMGEAEFDRVIAVDLRGVFLCMKYQIPAMLASGGGAIVNTASVAGVIADPGMAPYAAAKHGVIGLTRSAALDYATRGIRVNALAPGLIRTPMTDHWIADPEMMKALMANSPMGRAAEPEEMAGIVLFLCSTHASFINGAVYLADGGMTAH